MLLEGSVASELSALNVLFLQPQVYIDERSQLYRFLFSRNNDSYSTAAQRNRQLLAVNDLTKRNRVDLIAVLDDDLIFQNAILTRDSQAEVCVAFDDTFDYLLELDKIHTLTRGGPVAGGNSGCPPIPGLLGMKGAIADLKNALANVTERGLILAQYSCYYYDISDQNETGGTQGAWLKYCYNSEYVEPSICNVFWGVTPTRPLIFDKDALLKDVRPTTRIGGNTYFSSANELLLVPHLSLSVEGVSTRRSDMIVAEMAKGKGITYKETYFPLGHLRVESSAGIGNEVVCRVIESEIFGVSFHRGVRSFVEGHDYKREWQQMFESRRDSVIANLISTQGAILELGNDNDGSAFGEICDPEYVGSHLAEKYQTYFENYVMVMENLEEIQRYWIDLMENGTYEIDYSA
jgi:hypothetical protein